MTRKTEVCDHCGGAGKGMTDCGYEACDHCWTKNGLIRKTQSTLFKYYWFGDEMKEFEGKKPSFSHEAKILIGMNWLFNKSEYGKPMMIIQEVVLN